MQIGGPKFKTNTIAETAGPAPAEQAQDGVDSLVEDYFEDAFGATGTTGASDTPNANAIDDYTAGMTEDAKAVATEEDAVASWLENFPPTPEEVMANNENAVEYLDLLMQRYDKAKEDLSNLCIKYRESLNAENLTADQMRDIRAKLDLAERAIGRCDEFKQRVTELGSKQDNIYVAELKDMKDYNNDNYIGRYKHGIGVIENDDGTKTYFDPETKTAIPNPLMDQDYKPELFSSGGIKKISKESALNLNPNDDEVADLYLKLTPEALTNFLKENIYEAPIDIGVPEYMWVEKDKDRWEAKITDSDNEAKMVLYDKWSTDGGISQEVPTDRSKYMQVQVTSVKVRTVSSGLTAEDGTDLGHTVIEFYDRDENLIARVRIEGFATDTPIPASVDTTDGRRHYVAANALGLSIHGTERSTPIILDASEYCSIGRHTVDNLAKDLGLEGDGKAFDTNIGNFRDNKNVDFDYSSDGVQYNDVYVSDEKQAPGKDEDILSNRTGIFVRDFASGDITGPSGVNNVIWTQGVNWQSDYAKDHTPKNSKKIRKDDPFYYNRINAGENGSNIVVAGEGNNFVFGATLAWLESGSRTESYICTPEVHNDTSNSTVVELSNNPATFVHADGGIVNIDNAVEDPDGAEVESEITKADKNPKTTDSDHRRIVRDIANEDKNDRYDIETGTRTRWGNPKDPEIPKGNPGEEGATNIDGEILKLSDIEMTKFVEQLKKVPEVDETEIASASDELTKLRGQVESEISAEMDGFFNDLSGTELSSFDETENGAGTTKEIPTEG